MYVCVCVCVCVCFTLNEELLDLKAMNYLLYELRRYP